MAFSFADKRISLLTWINKKAKLQSSAAPSVVKQKEIFFCELGVNIGSEQGGKRPVVIMQNDIFVYDNYIKSILTFDDTPITIPTSDEIEYMASSSDIQSSASPENKTSELLVRMFCFIEKYSYSE